MSNRKYELFFVLPGTLNDQEAVAGAEAVLSMVKNSAEEVELHTLGKNRLAYPIKQIRYGYFYAAVFSTTPEKLGPLEKALSLSREILRSMVSHYNTSLTAQQKIAYSTDNAGVTTMSEKPAFTERVPVSAPAPASDTKLMVDKLMGEDVQVEKKVKSPVERKIDSSNLDEINKRLDDLISGDIMPTV